MTPCSQDGRQQLFEANYSLRTEEAAGTSEFLVPMYQTKRHHVRDSRNATNGGCQKHRRPCYVIITTEKYAFIPSKTWRNIIIIIIVVVIIIIINTTTTGP